MLSKIKGFVGRHKKKFIFGGVVIAGGILLRYAQRKFIEYQEKVKILYLKFFIELCTYLYKLQQVKEFLEKTRRLQHFESTEKTTDQAIIGISL